MTGGMTECAAKMQKAPTFLNCPRLCGQYKKAPRWMWYNKLDTELRADVKGGQLK